MPDWLEMYPRATYNCRGTGGGRSAHSVRHIGAQLVKTGEDYWGQLAKADIAGHFSFWASFSLSSPNRGGWSPELGSSKRFGLHRKGLGQLGGQQNSPAQGLKWLWVKTQA